MTTIEELLDLIGWSTITATLKRFNEAVAPSGRKWSPIKHRTGQILKDTGQMYNSFKHVVKGDTVRVFNNAEYFAKHQLGIEVKQRPMLDIKEENLIENRVIEKGIDDYMNLQLKKFMDF